MTETIRAAWEKLVLSITAMVMGTDLLLVFSEGPLLRFHLSHLALTYKIEAGSLDGGAMLGISVDGDREVGL